MDHDFCRGIWQIGKWKTRGSPNGTEKLWCFARAIRIKLSVKSHILTRSVALSF